MENKEKVKDLLSRDRYCFADLCTIMEILRGEGGCPWDREQTHVSIRNNFIEETYEVVEAIDCDDKALLREDLGDVLLQVVFHERMEEEAGLFNIDDFANDICAKLIRRHPHIFGSVTANTTDEVLSDWEAIKADEKSRVTLADKLHAIPPMLPALMRAEKVGKNMGVDHKDGTDSVEAAVEKLHAQLSAIKDAGSGAAYGEFLYTAVSLGRLMHLEAETELTHETNRRIESFCTENSISATQK